jgi:hypothetical protein
MLVVEFNGDEDKAWGFLMRLARRALAKSSSVSTERG